MSRSFLLCFREPSRTFTCARFRSSRQVRGPSGTHRQVLNTRYPRRVVDTLLAAYRPSSRRQHDLAWRHFQAWLPADVSEISRVQVLEFLQHLFDEVTLSPRTVLCYRAALKWPLQEAFQVNFGHDDFSRQATGFFHLRHLRLSLSGTSMRSYGFTLRSTWRFALYALRS